MYPCTYDVGDQCSKRIRLIFVGHDTSDETSCPCECSATTSSSSNNPVCSVSGGSSSSSTTGGCQSPSVPPTVTGPNNNTSSSQNPVNNVIPNSTPNPGIINNPVSTTSPIVGPTVGIQPLPNNTSPVSGVPTIPNPVTSVPSNLPQISTVPNNSNNPISLCTPYQSSQLCWICQAPPLSVFPFCPQQVIPSVQPIQSSTPSSTPSVQAQPTPQQPTTTPPVPAGNKTQFTPEYSAVPGLSGADCIRKLSALTLLNPDYANHGPSGMKKYDTALWNKVHWDGQIRSACDLTKEQLASHAWPNGDAVMLGLKEKYDSIRPFSDEMNPTVAEIDNWNFDTIRHFRSLWGITVPIEPSRELFLQAQWAKEYRDSNFWDSRYPPPGTANCSSTNKVDHCGFSWFPTNPDDQTPYLEGGAPVTTNSVLSEGLGPLSDPSLPWWIKFSSFIKHFVEIEGRTGHPGPIWKRTCMGINFNCKGDSVEVRIDNGCNKEVICNGED